MEGASAAGSPRRRAASTGCGPVVEALEPRTFLSVAATNVGGYRLTLRDRETLYSWLKRGSLKNDLDRILHVNEYATSEQRMAAFDGRLLQHMRTRTYAPYFFKPDDADNIAQDLASNGDLAASAERRVGEATDALADPTPDTRGNSWITLALAYRYTSVVGPSIAGGNNATDYSTALIDKLGYWTRIRASSPYWDGVVDPLNTSKRAESWTKAYYLVLSAPAWTKEANTLFLFQMYKTGYTLANAERSTVANQRAAHTAGLMICARMYSFFADAAADWKPLANYWLDGEDFGNNNLRQFRPDGGHMEQSPNYAMVTTRILTNLSVLSTLQGEPWKHGRNDLLCSAFDAIYDVIDPTGSLPAIGDTYRFPGAMEIFVMPQVLFNQPSSRWGDLRPSIDDMLVLWKLQSKLDFNAPLAGADSIPSNSRGRSSNLRKSGMFVMRAGNDAQMSDTRQLLFENGPYGSSNNGGHGHFDMLNIELAGYGRTLIADPGPENYDSAE